MRFVADLNHRRTDRVVAAGPIVRAEPAVERRQAQVILLALALAAEALIGRVPLEADGTQGRKTIDVRVEQRVDTVAGHGGPEHGTGGSLAQETGARVVARPARRIPIRRRLGWGWHERNVEQMHEAKHGTETTEAGLYAVPDARRAKGAEQRRRRRRGRGRGRSSRRTRLLEGALAGPAHPRK
jgi:hypothetical protein